MLHKKLFMLLLTVILNAYAQDDIEALLDSYQDESKLSKITRKDSAGFVDVYTRDELEKMQVHTLQDVFKSIPGFTLTRGVNNIPSFLKPTSSNISSTSARFYINDHDMTSTSFGSAAHIWGDMPIEYIDHIEIYKATASIEFGNETAPLIFKVYTKTALREEGGKVRLVTADNGSLNLDLYHAKSFDNDFSYFVYSNKSDIDKNRYTNEFDSKNYIIKSDKSAYNLYANFAYKDSTLELGQYAKTADSFLGIGSYKTPTDGTLEARHSYIHFTEKFDNNFKIELAYDNLKYDRTYCDENNMSIVYPPSRESINNYNIIFSDEIITAIVEKTFKNSKNKLLVGAFYKYKSFEEKGRFSDVRKSFYYENKQTNRLDLFSIYAEENYFFSDTFQFVASLKGDFFRYKKDVDPQNKYIARVGFIKNVENFQLKSFYSLSYIPASFIQLYNSENIPYKANPHLKYMDIDLFGLSLKYKNQRHEVEVIVVRNGIDNRVTYDPSTTNGYVNLADPMSYSRLELKYSYLIDRDNKIYFDYFTGRNSKGMELSPSFGINVKSFNSFGKFDLYNEFIYKNSYELAGIKVDYSLDYTMALKYHFDDDLSVGFRGENILNRGFEQVYKGLSYSIPVTDRRFWVNMEYLF